MKVLGRSFAILITCVTTAACTHPAPSDGRPSGLAVTQPTSASPGDTWTYVALGDSWPEGAHCGGCRTFAGRYVDGLRAQTGRTIVFDDLTGEKQPFFDTDGGGSASLLKALRRDPTFRSQVAQADIVLIATGPNDGSRFVPWPWRQRTCGGRDGMACIQALGRFWLRNFDAILNEIERLRGGRPTAIRLVNAANPFLNNPEMDKRLPKRFPSGPGAAMFEELKDAVCGAARSHEAVCIDVRPIINGPPGAHRYPQEDSARAMQGVADALLATGLLELGQR